MHQTTKTRLLTTLLLASTAQPLHSMDYAYDILYGTGIAILSGAVGGIVGGHIGIAVDKCLRRSKLYRRTFHGFSLQLLDATEQGDRDEIKRLVKEGADINTTDLPHNHLYAAFLNHRYEIVDYFLEQGINLDAFDNSQRSAIRIAAMHNYPLHKLLAAGASINSKSGIYKNTALHSCALWGDLPNTRQLIEYGANINIENDEKKTPIDLARAQGNLELFDYLQNTHNYLINRIILTKKDSTTPNYGLLALRTFNHCDISFLRGDSSVDLPHLIKVWQWHKQEHFTSDIKSSLREMIWIDLDNKTTTPDTLEKNIVKISERHKVAFCYNLHRKILRREQQKQKSADVYFSFKHQ